MLRQTSTRGADMRAATWPPALLLLLLLPLAHAGKSPPDPVTLASIRKRTCACARCQAPFPHPPRTANTVPSPHALLATDVQLVFATPFILYQNSTADPLVRLGSLRLGTYSKVTHTYMCSYPDGTQPDPGQSMLLLPSSLKTMCVARSGNTCMGWLSCMGV